MSDWLPMERFRNRPSLRTTAIVLAAMVFYAIGATSSIAAPTRALENPYGIAVIIGNKNYTHPDVPEVSFAHRDADAIKRYVIETLGFRERNIIDLRDATQSETEGVFGNERDYGLEQSPDLQGDSGRVLVSW